MISKDISKELNAILLDDKQREQWLKRLLPALVVIVIYFVFISSYLTEKTNKAEDAYNVLFRQGIDETRLSDMRERNGAIRTQLDELRKQDQRLQADLSTKAGFLYGKGNEFDTVPEISALMMQHGLQVYEYPEQPNRKINELPRSVGDLKKWLSDMLNKNDTIRVYRFVFAGKYVNVYEALNDMAMRNIKTLPLSLTMKDPDDKQALRVQGKVWTLDVWL